MPDALFTRGICFASSDVEQLAFAVSSLFLRLTVASLLECEGAGFNGEDTAGVCGMEGRRRPAPAECSCREDVGSDAGATSVSTDGRLFFRDRLDVTDD